jgi:DNA primase
MNDSVQKIKDRLSIVDVVAPYVELHKAGRHFKGKSPFANEKTPSFYVSPDRGMYYCFSTSQGGYMFKFVQTMEGVDFKEALKILAAKANVELTPVSPEKKTERDRAYAILDDAAKFYQECLLVAKPASAYLDKRGVNKSSLEAWRIGFAPGPPEAGWGVVKEHLMKKGYTEKELFAAGLIKNSDKGKESYDVFRNRVMFPLFDQSGRVVGFSGRTMESGPDIPKYVNSPETDLYKKSELLYGYDKAKHGIRNLNFSLIVEGQFDVVMSHQSGYSNTVAVSGTALTPMHVQLLERLSNKVVLALDADKAGLAAVRRAADLMLRRGLDVKVASLVGGKDPADIVLADSREYKHIIGQSAHVIEFLLATLLAEKLDERTLKLRAREEIIPYILLLPNHIDQDHFEGKLAEALKTTKEAIHYEVERLNEKKKSAGTMEEEIAQAPVKQKANVNEIAQRYTSLLTYVLGSMQLFEESVLIDIKLVIEEITGKTIEELEALVTTEARAEVLFRVETFLDRTPRRIFEEEFVHSLNLLREVVIRRQLKEAREKMEESERLGGSGDSDEAMKQVSQLQISLQLKPYDTSILKAK